MGIETTEEKTRAIYRNIERDEATTGRNQNKFDAQPGLADEDQPEWRPPEGEPEPRPVEPIATNAPDAE